MSSLLTVSTERVTSRSSTLADTSTSEFQTTMEPDFFFFCDFSTSCFGGDKFYLTDGQDFKQNNSDDQILAPGSDVSSIS